MLLTIIIALAVIAAGWCLGTLIGWAIMSAFSRVTQHQED